MTKLNQTKVHPLLVREIARALERIFHQGSHADRVIEAVFKANRKWGSRDRRFFAEGIYEIIRYHRRYLAALPDARENFIQLWAVYWTEKGHELPTMPELAGFQKSIVEKKLNEDVPRAIRESVPDWLDQLGEQSFGSRWSNLLSALNRPAEVILRVNTLKATRDVLKIRLKEEGINVREIGDAYPDALILEQRANVFASKSFHEGLFEIQDASSQCIAPMLRCEPGMRVVDACAGAGGKSLHLASIMKNKGKILSLDIHEWKLKELQNRARRNSVAIIETRVIDSSKTIKRLDASADRLLLDVPCSGLGVLRRNPDKKWKTSLEEIQRILDLQSEILSQYSRIVKPGGLMVYATCSILPSENEQQIEKFCRQNPQWIRLEERHWMPDTEGFDGFYACLLQRQSLHE